MNAKPRFAWLIAGATILSTILAACGGPATPIASTSATSTVAPSNTEAIPAAEPVAAAGERLLRISGTNVPPPDPSLASAFVDYQGLVNMYDSLVIPNAAGGVDPLLATSWEISDDGLTYTFVLRQDVKFHNGDDLTASDVVYTLNRMLAMGGGFAYLFEGQVADVSAPGDYTVVVTTNQPSGLFIYSFSRLYVLNEAELTANTVTPGDYGEFGDYGRQYLTTADAGSGPYKVKELRPQESLTLEKNADWFGTFRPNAPDQVIFIPTTEPATQRTLMANRELEINDQWQSIESYRALDELEGVDIAALPSGSGLYLMMHTRKPPTDDVHFRRALSYAFDYTAAVGLDWPGTKQLQGPVPSNLPGFNPDIVPFSRDLDRAREELALSKYADQLDEIVVTIESASDAHDERFSLLFQANMAEIGIQVEVLRPPWLTMFEHLISQEAGPNLALIYVQPDFPDAGALLYQKYHSKSTGTWSQSEWLLDDAFDAQLDKALSTSDAEQRYAQERELQTYIMDLAPTIFVSEQVTKHAYQSGYVNWPAANGEVIPVIGYEMYAPLIEVYPEKRAALMGN